jgi:antitoxin component YwqK of YwqJK toxin-antitoxin module
MSFKSRESMYCTIKVNIYTRWASYKTHMKTAITILFIFLSLNTLGQVICHTDNYDYFWLGDTINRTVNGKKQGLWIIIDHTIKCNDCKECLGSSALLSYKIVAQGNYLNDKKVGNWRYFYNDSAINCISKYQDGALDSTNTSYDLSGNVISRSFYTHGEKDSVIVYYNIDKIKYRGYYTENKLFHFTIYYPNGQMKYNASQISELRVNYLEYFDENGKELIPREKDILIIATNEKLIQYIE